MNTKIMDPEKAKTDRKNARTIFTRKRNELLRSVRDRRIADVIEDDYAELVKAWKELEGKHNAYIELLKDDEMNSRKLARRATKPLHGREKFKI